VSGPEPAKKSAFSSHTEWGLNENRPDSFRVPLEHFLAGGCSVSFPFLGRDFLCGLRRMVTLYLDILNPDCGFATRTHSYLPLSGYI
jgi:hypothetical protein